MSPFSSPPSFSTPESAIVDSAIVDSAIVDSAATDAANQKKGAGCLIAFCALFALIGASLLFALFLRPVSQVFAARNWPAVPCQITSSVVSPHADSDGDTTYSADIVYQYFFGGQNRVSSHYSFGRPLQGRYAGRAALIAQYPVGSAATCYVNPNNPNQAVLQHGITNDVWIGLFSLPFLAFGLGGIWMVTRAGRENAHPRASWHPKNAVPSANPLILRPKSSPYGRFVGLGLMSAFWNGIIGFMVWKIVIEGDGGRGFSVFGALFFIPFVFVGVLMFGAWLQSGLALGNARPVLTLSRSLSPGQSAEIRYELRGGLFWPKTVEITLEGREEAVFSRGTDTVTDTSAFFFATLLQTEAVQNGVCAVSIPAGAMHSLDAPHNKIVWILKLSGPIARWPDIAEEWQIPVFPAK